MTCYNKMMTVILGMSSSDKNAKNYPSGTNRNFSCKFQSFLEYLLVVVAVDVAIAVAVADSFLNLNVRGEVVVAPMFNRSTWLRSLIWIC